MLGKVGKKSKLKFFVEYVKVNVNWLWFGIKLWFLNKYIVVLFIFFEY